MNLKLVEPSDYKKWDVFVINHPYGWVTHLSSWKTILENNFKHVQGYLYALVDHHNDILAGLPIYQVESWFIGKRMVSVPFATICDPLVSDNQQSSLLFDLILKAVGELKINTIEMRALNSTSYLDEVSLDFEKINSFKQHYLILDKSLEELKQSFNKRNVRKRIRQSIKKDLTIRVTKNKADFDKFYHLYLLTKKRLGLPAFPYRFILQLWKLYSPLDQLDLILAEQNKKIVGGLIYFKFRNRVSTEIIAYNETYRNLYLSHFLYWHAIEIAKSEGYEIFDFGKTSIFNEGLMNYKSHWGTKLKDMPVYVYPKSVKFDNEPRENLVTYKIIKSISKKLPTSIFKIYSNLFYHHFA